MNKILKCRFFIIFFFTLLNLCSGCIQKNQIVVSLLNKNINTTSSDGTISNTPVASFTYALGLTQSSKLVLNKIENATGIVSTVATYTLPGAIGAFEISKNNTRIFVQVNNSNLYLYGINKTTNPPSINLLSNAAAVVTGNASDLWGICAAPDGSSAHLVQYSTTRLYSFKVDTNDLVSYVGMNSQAPNYLTNCRVTADSKYVISAGYSANAVSFLINNTTKALTKITGVAAGDGPSWIEQSEDSKFFFVPAQNVATVKAFEMDLTTGIFVHVDSIAMPGAAPDYIDVKANGSKLYVNSQGGSVYYIPFDRTTKRFGIASAVSNIAEWFTLDKLGSIYFQNQGANTNIYFLNEDGTFGNQGSSIVGENNFKTFSL